MLHSGNRAENEHLDVLRRPVSRPSCEITIQAQDGVVTLNGRPESVPQTPCGVLAWWVPAVRDVINGLEETPSQQDNDQETTEAVSLVFEKEDPFVNASEIRVNTRNRLVTLDGVLATQEHRQMAESDGCGMFLAWIGH